MIVCDTETTGLIEPMSLPLDRQPHIVEFAAIKLDDVTLEEVGRMEFLCKPPVQLTPEIMGITNLTNEILADKPPFAFYFEELVEFFLGQRHFVAHNAAFDASMIAFECRRLGLGGRFPWPRNHICTVEKSNHIDGFRLKLAQLHEKATGENHINHAHRAMADTEALVKGVRWLHAQGKLF